MELIFSTIAVGQGMRWGKCDEVGNNFDVTLRSK